MSMSWGSMRTKPNELVNLLGLLAVAALLWLNALVLMPRPAHAQPLCQPHEVTGMWVEPLPEPPVVHDYDQTITVTPPGVTPENVTPELPPGPAWDAPHNNVT